MKNRLTIAIQKNGRLSDQSRDLIKKSGINFTAKGDKLLAKSNNLPIDILFVRSDDIPSLVSNGDADIAIVGENILIEKSSEPLPSFVSKLPEDSVPVKSVIFAPQGSPNLV